MKFEPEKWNFPKIIGETKEHYKLRMLNMMIDSIIDQLNQVKDFEHVDYSQEFNPKTKKLKHIIKLRIK